VTKQLHDYVFSVAKLYKNHPFHNFEHASHVTMSVANVSVRWYGDLVFVESINGIANDPAAGKWWQYWVNGQYGPIASNKYVLSDSDSVSWKRTGNAFAGNDGNELQLTSTVMVVGGAVLIAATLASLGKRLRR
ncbi:MAG: DUF4430 domain-containing protein, partial [Candidatus Thorarchaeota archaeon]